MANTKVIKFTVLGKRWELRLMTDQEYYRKRHRWDTLAVTYTTKRRIHFSPDGLDRETIVHELLHAYLAEMCTYSASLDKDQLEEVFAELISKRGYELLQQADALHGHIKRKAKEKCGTGK